MTAQDIINLAKNAELKQLAIKNDDDAILGYLNLGLLELYKRFPLEEAEAVLSLKDGKTTYRLDGADADVDMDIDKTVLVVVGAYTIDSKGKVVAMPINDEESLLGVNTPTYNTVEVPTTIDGAFVSVIYRVAPAFLTSPDDTVALPPQLLEALLNYIGYRGHGSISGELKAENQSHYVRFENSCNRVVLDGLIAADNLVSKKLYARGFV